MMSRARSAIGLSMPVVASDAALQSAIGKALWRILPIVAISAILTAVLKMTSTIR